MKKIFILPSILFLFALAPMPYGYYYILKFVVLITSIIEITFLVELNNNEFKNDIIFLGAIALLYNPIIIIPLGRPFWTIVNIGTVLYYLFYSNKINTSN